MQVTYRHPRSLMRFSPWIIVLVLVPNLSVRGQESIDIHRLERDLCSSPVDVGRSNYRGHFSVAAMLYVDKQDSEGLQKMMSDVTTSLALLSAWETVRRADATTVQQRADWFVGFYQGRTRTFPPPFWTRRLRELTGGNDNAYPDESERRRICTVNNGEGERGIHIANAEMSLHRSQDVHIDNGKIIFRRNQQQCSVDEDIFKGVGKGKGADLHYYLDSKILVVALVENSGSKFPVYCFSVDDGKLKWSETAWGNLSGDNLPRAGFLNFTHCIEIQRQNELILVFGENGSPYCDAFYVDNGKCAFRFSTCYWYARQYRAQVAK